MTKLYVTCGPTLGVRYIRRCKLAVKKKPLKKPTYRSGFEKKVAASLKDRKVPFKYEQGKVPYIVPESKHNYVPDFELPNGIMVEAKGKLDRAARKKMVLVIAQNPDLDIRMLFMRDNYIAKGSKTKYSEWCKKNGIKYHVSVNGDIPDSWIAEEKKP